MEKATMNKGKDDNSLLRNYETEFNEITSLKYKEQPTCQNRILHLVKMYSRMKMK